MISAVAYRARGPGFNPNSCQTFLSFWLSVEETCQSKKLFNFKTKSLFNTGLFLLQVYLLTEQIEKAVKDFDKSVELNPSFPTAYVQKLYTDYRQAMQQNSEVKIKNVLNLFEKALDKYPDCIETYALFAQVFQSEALSVVALQV